MRTAVSSIAAASLAGTRVAGADADADARGVAGRADSERGRGAAVTSTVGTGWDTAGDEDGAGDGAADVDSVSLGATIAGGCVVELDGGVLGGVDGLVGAAGLLGAAAGGMRRLPPRPSMSPVA